METLSFQREKMRELVLFVAQSEVDDPYFGRVKLAKLLYYIDNEAFLKLGKSITGARYQKLPEGPAAREFVPLRDEMMAKNEAKETEQDWGDGFTSLRLVAIRDADLEIFSKDEIAVINGVIAKFAGVSGTSISKISHEEFGWRLTPMAADIPYFAYLLAPRLTDAQRDFAKSKVASLVAA